MSITAHAFDGKVLQPIQPHLTQERSLTLQRAFNPTGHMVVARWVDDAVDALTATRPRHLEVTTRMRQSKRHHIIVAFQLHRTRRENLAQSLMHSYACTTMRQTTNPVQLPIGGEIFGRDSRLQQTVAQRGIPAPRMNAAWAQFSDFAEMDRRYIEMMI